MSGLFAYCHGFDPIHQIEAPDSKLVQVESVDAIELSHYATDALQKALAVCGDIFYNTHSTSSAVMGCLVEPPDITVEEFVDIMSWLDKNEGRWIGLRHA